MNAGLGIHRPQALDHPLGVLAHDHPHSGGLIRELIGALSNLIGRPNQFNWAHNQSINNPLGVLAQDHLPAKRD